ncbi:MAG: site-specific integrase [Nitrospirae bacterium]|nr:site-specific integrase [Nitrospirota bacterium]
MAKHKGLYKQKGSDFYWLRYVGHDGKVIRESAKTTNFKEAQAKLENQRRAIREGKEPEPIKRISNFTFRQLSEQYLIWAERQRSFRSKRGFILQLVDVFGNLPLRSFNTMQIEQFQTRRIEKGNKPATVNRLLATMKHMFTKAVQWEMADDSTFKKIRQVRLLEENNRRLRYLSKDECKELLRNCNGYLNAIVTFALNTGCRRGEILSVKWDNIDLTHGFIRLDRTKNGECRDIPINDDLKAVLQSITRRLDIPYVFFDETTGKPFNDVKRSFQTACRRAGIRDFHFHDLRHTFASHLVMGGVDITTVSKLLGHKSLTMTLRYSHLSPNHLQNAVNVLDITGNADEKRTAYLLHSQAVN